jgi:hypothetical protein
MAPAKKPPGKGLVEKRRRILRCLATKVRYLAMCERLGPWTPPPSTREPRPKQTPEEWAAYWERHAPVRKWTPREKPSLAHPVPGPEALSEEDVKAWVAGDPFVRSGLQPATQRAMAFIGTFAPKRILAPEGAARRAGGQG